MSLQDDDVPILTDVVQAGNKSVIRSTRHEILAADRIAQSLSEQTLSTIESRGEALYCQSDNPANINGHTFDGTCANDKSTNDVTFEQALDIMIQNVLDQHIDELRQQLSVQLRHELDRWVKSRT